MEKVRSRAYFITEMNYDELAPERVDKFCQTGVYGIWCRETAPTTGTPHLHWYVRWKNARQLSAIKKLFPRAKIEVAKGDDADQYIYMSKTDPNFKQYGVMSAQGKRTDLDEVKNEIMEGKRVDDIVLENPELYHYYGRTLHKIEDLRMRKVFRKHQTKGYWLWGETGCGKSDYAFYNFHPDTHYKWNYDGGWNDAYAQQDIVIVDEFRGQMPMNELLTMIDKHPNYSVRRRGREPLPFTSKKVYITCSKPPEEVYHNLSENDKIDQLFRRIEVIHFEKTETFFGFLFSLFNI